MRYDLRVLGGGLANDIVNPIRSVAGIPELIAFLLWGKGVVQPGNCLAIDGTPAAKIEKVLAGKHFTSTCTADASENLVLSSENGLFLVSEEWAHFSDENQGRLPWHLRTY